MNHYFHQSVWYEQIEFFDEEYYDRMPRWLHEEVNAWLDNKSFFVWDYGYVLH